MDYKTNILTKQVTADTDLLPEINGLHFAIMGEGRAVFDYTAYFTENEAEFIDHKVFMRMNRRYIEAVAESRGRKTTELFYQDAAGHILADASLVFIFLAFAQKDLCVYFNDILADALSEGVAYSTGFVYSMAAKRLPDDVLRDIITNRKRDEEAEAAEQ